MRDAFVIGLVVFVAVLVVAGLFVLLPMYRRSDRPRRNAFAQWAASHGWHYDEGVRPAWVARLPGRDGGGVAFTLTGVAEGRRVTVAEYGFDTHRFVVVVVHLDRPYPPVAVLDRSLSLQLGDAHYGATPLHTGHAGFDRRFRVTAVDRQYARLMLDPEVVEALLADLVPRWSLAGRDLLTYDLGRLRDPAAVPGVVAPLSRLADLLEERARA
ncbi:hypothetical protein [Nocardia farcinica]|uniref:hypothetical protein n=1 Tax=Nocardia farcinica TaxID=37329 RepID=UPI00189486A2|nr:hypothetical protein [Nocardia farcinica]MBF6444926.1 hypothetical protein [Nocardia farcinica]